MVIIHNGTRFEAISSYAEKDTVKAAGFRWEPASKRWWTDRPERASHLAQYADASAHAVLAKHLDAVDASMAPAATLSVPAPAGRSYLPYQLAGIAYALKSKGCLIGDEMGLGKTIQALGVINALPETKRVLVICPASLRLNWAREAGKWLVDSFKTTVITNGETLDLQAPGAQLVVINYDRLSKRPELLEVDWDVMIIDEVHYAKNPKAKRSQNVYALAKKAKRVLALTGTPILNRPIELHPILAMVDSANWGSFWSFAKRYCAAHQEWIPGVGQVWNMTGSSNLDELQEKLRATCMVRRLKADVLTELPAKRRALVPLMLKTWNDGEGAKVLEGIRDAQERAEIEAELAK